MGKRIFQIVFIIVVVAAFAKAINEYLSKIVSDPADYEFFIDEFPQGTVSRISTLKFTFAKDFDLVNYPINKPVQNDIIHFVPSIKGVLYWTDKRTIEFWPSEPLPEGTQYYYRINIDKIYKETNDKKVFRNKFNTPKIEYNINTYGLDYYTDSLFTAHGEISFTDYVDFKTIHKNVLVLQNKKQLPIYFTPTDLPLKFNFTVDSVERSNNQDTLNIFWKKNKKDTHYKISGITIPKLNEFTLLNEEINYIPHPEITLTFSDILDFINQNDSTKSINIFGSHNYTINDSANKLIISLFDSIPPDFIGIQLSENLKSNNGKILKEPIYKKVFINNQLPEIKNFFNFEIANIFSDNISFPLAAKNLNKVDITIYEIMPHNILQYLQNTGYKNTNELERVGRKIIEKNINLSTISNYNPNKLETYNINFQNIAINHSSAYHFIVKYHNNYITSTLPDSLLPSSDSISQLCMYSSIDAMVKKLPSDTLSIFVFNKSNGYPIRNADIKLYDYQQHELVNGQTDKFGNLNIHIKRNAIFLKVNYLENNLYIRIGNYNETPDLSYLNPFFFSKNSTFSSNDSLDFSFFFNNPITKYLTTTPFKYEFIAPNGNVIYSTIIPVNYSGINRIKHKIQANATEGKYTIKLKESDKVWYKKVCINNKYHINDSSCTFETFAPESELIKKKEGDTIRIKYTVPDNCYTLISLDNNSSILSNQWNTKPGNYIFKHSITADMWPAINVTITTYYKSGKQETTTKSYAIISPQKKLIPKIIAPFDVESGKNLNIRIEESNKQPMEYLIRLNFDDSLPHNQNPFYFYSNTFKNHIKTYYPTNENRSNTSAKYIYPTAGSDKNIVWGPYKLSEGSINNHKLDIPDIISNAYIEIIAANADQRKYGYASKKIWINTPVMVLCDIPNSIQPDEQLLINASAIVTKPESDSVTIEISSPENCTLLETSKYTFNQDSITNTHYFNINIKAKPVTENASVLINVSGNDFYFTKKLTIPVQSQNPKTISNNIKTIEPQSKWQTRITPTGFKGNNNCNIEFTVGEQMPVDYYLTKINQIDNYDILSKLSVTLPFLFHNEIYSESKNINDSVDNIIQQTIDELFTFQTQQGDFNNSIYSIKQNELFNCFAGYFLIECSKKGYYINNRKYNNWIRNIELNIRFSNFENSTIEQHSLPFKLYLTSLVKVPDISIIHSILTNNNISRMSKLYLSLALIESGKNKNGKTIYENITKANSNYSFAENTLRLEITRLLKQNAENENLRKLLLNELDSNKLILVNDVGMGLYFMEKSILSIKNPHKFNIQYRINKGKETNITGNSLYSIKNLPFDYTLPKTVDITNTGKQLIQTSITMSSIIQKPESIYSLNGLSMKITYSDSTGQKIDITNLKRDNIITATIELSNNSKEQFGNLLLIFPVISGWKIITEANHNYLNENNNLIYKVSLNSNENIIINTSFKAAFAGNFYHSPCRLINLNTGNTLIQFPVKEITIK